MRTGSKFRQPEQSVGTLTAADAARTIATAADIAIVLDRDGVVQDFSFRNGGLEAELKDVDTWQGRHLTDMLTNESRPKIAALLTAATQDRDPTLRQVNHLSANGGGVAIEYAAVQTTKDGPIIAFGRDLRPLSLLQQRLVDAQQTMARDYALQRQAETRFRVLFETSPEPLIVLEAQSLKVTDINPAARRLVGANRRSSGWPFADLFATADRQTVGQFLSIVRNTGGADSIRVHLASRTLGPNSTQPGAEMDSDAATLTASLLVEEPSSVILVRLLSGSAAVPSGVSELKERLLTAVEQAPDGFVFTDGDGNILVANTAFLTMVQLTTVDQVRGRKLGVWLGQPGVDVEVLLTNLRQRGSVQLFGSTLRGEHAQQREVEVSAVAVHDSDQPSFGFAVRDVGRRIAVAAPAAAAPLPKSVEQLTELIGRVPLKDLVRDATDVIERLCIEAALELTGDNRASAAEMLGLSRQSLYVRLRRYGMGDLDDGVDAS